MAGHSKWANIQHRKNAQDAKRGKIFTKLIREITVAARMGGADPVNNPRLRAAMAAALSHNMAKDTIERAIKKGAGGLDGANVEELTYEGYAAGGVAVLVECMTDNRNRTVSEVRHAFTKCSGNLGQDGSVAYLFSKCGQLIFPPGSPEDKIMEIALEASAEDIQVSEDGSIEVITAQETFSDVKEAMQRSGIEPIQAELTMQAANYIKLDKDTAEKVLKMIDMLEDLDDVQNVYHNAEIDSEIYEALAK
jgi:YebC/PmpR family DNA-binding regulatory protein